MSIRQGDIHIPKIDMKEPLALECSHFVDCVLGGRRPLTDGRDGLAVVELLSAMQQSMKEGGARVDLVEVSASQENQVV
jgi:predicted dehydrogenase